MLDFNRNRNYTPVPIRIFDRKKNVTYAETSLIAFYRDSGKVIAVGNEAIPLTESADNGVEVLSPLRHGMIADFMAADAMFRGIFQKASLIHPLLKPKIAVCVPSEITEVEARALQDVFYHIGAKEVCLLDEKAETAMQSLPPAYGILVEIAGNQIDAPDGGGEWEEVCREKLPEDHYHITLIERRESEIGIMLTGSVCRVEIKFSRALAMCITAGDFMTDLSMNSREVTSFRNTHAKSGIYQIREKQTSSSVAENGLSQEDVRYRKRYRILGDEDLAEVWSDEEPSVMVLPLEKG